MKTILIDFQDSDDKKAFLDRFAETLTNLTIIPMRSAVVRHTQITVELNDKADAEGTETLLDACAKIISANASATIYEPPVSIKCAGCGKVMNVRQMIADAERYILHAHHEYDEADFRRHYDWTNHTQSSYLLALTGHNEWMPWCGRKDCQI